MDVKKKIVKKANFFLALGLCLILACSGIAYLFNTSVGKVITREVSYETEYGSLAGTVYKPQRAYPVAALADNSTPAVVLAHDYGGSRDNMSMAAIELTRRGYAVFSIDLYGHGHSTLKSHFRGDISALEEFNAGGVWDAVRYLNNIPYINKGKIAIAVHGNAQLDLATKALQLDNAQWDKTSNRLIAAVLYVGNTPADTSETLLRNRDVGIMLSTKDEFGMNNDYLSSNEAHILVNAFQISSTKVPSSEPITNGLASLKTPGYLANIPIVYENTALFDNIQTEPKTSLSPTQTLLQEIAALQQSRDYPTPYAVTYQWTRISATGTRTTITAASGGTSETYTLGLTDRVAGVKLEVKVTLYDPAFRGVYMANVTHSRLSSSFTGAKAYINFFGMAQQVRPSTYLTAEATSEIGQTWWIKELSTGIALVGFFMFVLGAVFALYNAVNKNKTQTAEGGEVEGVVAVQPYVAEAPNSKHGKLIYWVGLGLIVILSGIFFWLAFQAGGGAISDSFNAYFNQPITNGILTALIVVGIVQLGLFVLMAILNKKVDGGADLKARLNNGLTEKAPNIVKSLLIVIGVVFAGFCIEGFMQWLWQVDFRIWLWQVTAIETRVFGSIIKYIPFFAVYFVINSFVINNGIAAKRKEVGNYLLAVAVSVGGLVLVSIIYYFGILGGANLFGQSLLPIVNLMVIPLLALSAIISRLAYNKTGSIWLGSILNTVLMTALLCVGTVTLF